MELMKKKLVQETKIKQEAFEKIETLKEEIRSLESGNVNATTVQQLKELWKDRQINNEALRMENEQMKRQLENAMQIYKYETVRWEQL